VHPLVVGHVGHVPGRGDRRLGLDVGHQDRQPRFGQQPRDPHGRPVGEHHHHDPVEVGVLELAHRALGVLAVLDRLARDELGHVRKVRGDLAGVARLPLGNAGDHLVVQVLHDAQDPDSGLAVRHDIPP
jgi:hypothetical protein